MYENGLILLGIQKDVIKIKNDSAYLNSLTVKFLTIKHNKEKFLYISMHQRREV